MSYPLIQQIIIKQFKEKYFFNYIIITNESIKYFSYVSNWCTYYFFWFHFSISFWLTLTTDYNETRIWNWFHVINKEAFQEGFDQV